MAVAKCQRRIRRGQTGGPVFVACGLAARYRVGFVGLARGPQLVCRECKDAWASTYIVTVECLDDDDPR